MIAGRKDPEQLERAINMLGPETQEEAAVLWNTRRARIERDAKETLTPVSPDEPLENRPRLASPPAAAEGVLRGKCGSRREESSAAADPATDQRGAPTC